MRSIFLSSAACCLLFSLQALPAAEDADAVYKQGVSKLRDSQSDHAALVPATKLLAHAAELYEAAGDEAKVADVNSCLYWAKKKMTLADTETLHGEPVTSKRLEAAAKPVAVSEAKAMLDKADVFAKSHADDPLLVSIRFFEIADRFSDAPEGKKAMQQSLAAMQKVGEKSTLETYKPAPTDGKVFVKSEPVDAAIILITADGGKMNTGKKTPSLIQLPVGRQTLELAHKGYKPFALAVEVDGKAIAKPDAAKLEPLTVPVDISFEEGWMVFVDGKPAKAVGAGKAETPCTVELPLGGHELGLGKDGFLDIRQRVDVIEGGARVGQALPQMQLEIRGKAVKGYSILAKTKVEIERPKSLPVPRISIIRLEEFLKMDFPSSANLAGSGTTSASSTHPSSKTSEVLNGNRNGDNWILDGSSGDFNVSWAKLIRGRYVIIIAKALPTDSDSWGISSVTFNGSAKVELKSMDNKKVAMIDFGIPVDLSTLEIEIKGKRWPGICGIEVHPDKK